MIITPKGPRRHIVFKNNLVALVTYLDSIILTQCWLEKCRCWSWEHKSPSRCAITLIDSPGKNLNVKVGEFGT